MRQPAELGLRRAGDHQRVHAGGLRGHHVHHHAGRIDGVAARHVEADPLDGHPPLGDGRAGRQRGRGVGAPLVGVHGAGPIDRHLQRGANVGVERGQRGVQLGGRHADRRGPHAVERLAVLEGRVGAPLGDRVDDRAHLGHHRVHVDAAARQRSTQLRRAQRAVAQVDAGHRDRSHHSDCP